MKSKYSNYTTWEHFERKLTRNPNFQRAVKQTESEYQVAKSLILARKKRGLSQAALAKKANTKQPVISRLESGTHKASLALLERLATALNTTLTISFDSP